MTETFHLTPHHVWAAQVSQQTYAPEPFEREGFIHCTDGEDRVIEVGNRYYSADTRSFVCLVIDVDRVKVPVKCEDSERLYPHIYGRLNSDAVVRVRTVLRDPAGTFVALGD